MTPQATYAPDERDCWLILGFFLVAMAFSFISLTGSWPRYVMYLLPGIVVFLALSRSGRGPLTIDLPVAQFLLLYLIAAFLPTLYHGKLSFFTVRDFILIAIPLITFAYWFYIPEKAIRILFWGLIVVQVFNLVAQVQYGATIDGDVSLGQSKGIVESNLATPLAAMTIFFLCRGQYRYGIAALIATFVSFKRISFAGMLVAFIMYFALRAIDGNFKTIRPGPLSKMALFLFLILCVVVSRNINELVVYIDQFVNLYDIHPEQVLLGRYMLNDIAFQYLLDRADIGEVLVGFGVGAATAIIQPLTSIALLHNDLLKMQSEYGLLGLLLILTGWWRVFSRSYLGMTLFAFSATLWLTGNTLIYVFHSFVLFFLVRYDLQSLHSESHVDREHDPEAYRPT